MNLTPPSGSLLQVSKVGPKVVIEIPYPARPKNKYTYPAFHMAFSLFWFIIAFIYAGVGISLSWIFGEDYQLPNYEFLGLVIFLMFAGYTALMVRFFQPSRPISLVLSPRKLEYDQGRPKVEFPFMANIRGFLWLDLDHWEKKIEILLNRSVVREFNILQIKSLCLRNSVYGNQLTIGEGLHKVEIGPQLQPADREWLYAYLREYFSIGFTAAHPVDAISLSTA